MEKDSLESNSKYTIEFAQKKYINNLADFQVKMAMETQKLQLDLQLVSDAIAYLLDSEKQPGKIDLGFFLVKLKEEKAVGTLMLTYQNDAHWWMESVYVIEEERRKGHFKSLFHEAVRLGKEKKAKSIKLYVETQNKRAQNTYQQLGMHIVPEKMHSYDFVFDKFSLDEEKSDYQVEKVSNGKETLLKWVQDKQNILLGQKYEEIDWNTVYSIKKGDKLIAVTKLFPEFSDWRFGLMWYFRQLYLDQNEKQNYMPIMNEVMKMVIKDSELKVATIRIQFRQSQNLKFKGGHLEHYYIMQIKL